jgi:hypothetical protein
MRAPCRQPSCRHAGRAAARAPCRSWASSRRRRARSRRRRNYAQIGRAEVGPGGGRPGRRSFRREEVGRGGGRPGRRSAGRRAAGEEGGRRCDRRRCAGTLGAGSSSSSESERSMGSGEWGVWERFGLTPRSPIHWPAVAMIVISFKRYVYTGKRFDTSMRSCGKHVPGCFARLVQLRLWLWRKPATKPPVCFDCPAYSSGKQVKAQTNRPLVQTIKNIF